MTKKVLVALPPDFLKALDYISRVEHRTRSDTIREAVRKYIDYFKQKGVDYTDLAFTNN
jgi:metal-responsive CopG/Arc/MetJ family transcriptional regulator